MGARGRIDVGPLIAIPGALLLLVSLFLEWYEPEVNAWKVFEVWDLVLAAIALACLLAAAQRLGLAVHGAPAFSRGFVALGLASLVIVLSQAINHPPAAIGEDAAVGLWLGLGGAAMLALGAVLSTTRISLNVEGRARAAPPPAADRVPPAGSDPASRRGPGLDPARPDPPRPDPAGPAGGPAAPRAGEGETAPLDPPPPGGGPR